MRYHQFCANTVSEGIFSDFFARHQKQALLTHLRFYYQPRRISLNSINRVIPIVHKHVDDEEIFPLCWSYERAKPSLAELDRVRGLMSECFRFFIDSYTEFLEYHKNDRKRKFDEHVKAIEKYVEWAEENDTNRWDDYIVEALQDLGHFMGDRSYTSAATIKRMMSDIRVKSLSDLAKWSIETNRKHINLEPFVGMSQIEKEVFYDINRALRSLQEREHSIKEHIGKHPH